MMSFAAAPMHCKRSANRWIVHSTNCGKHRIRKATLSAVGGTGTSWTKLDPVPSGSAEPARGIVACPRDPRIVYPGVARSGTTILTRSLNRAREILLLEEPDFFDNQDVVD